MTQSRCCNCLALEENPLLLGKNVRVYLLNHLDNFIVIRAIQVIVRARFGVENEANERRY